MPASERERVNNWHVGQASLFSLASCRVRAQKAMVPDSSTLAWKIPWMEEPGRLQSMGLEESDTTERLHFHFSLSCIGEGNGNRLQYFCLENPRDGGAWWAAVYGVAQSRTQLMRLSSSSSSRSATVGSYSNCLILWGTLRLFSKVATSFYMQ